MRVDFYQLKRDPAAHVAAMLAAKALGTEAKVLIVAEENALLQAISRALWQFSADSFLANGMAGGAHDAHQPILLSHVMEATNGADIVILADGKWRMPDAAFARVMLLFDSETLDDARRAWRHLGEQASDTQRRFWKQDGARWVEGP